MMGVIVYVGNLLCVEMDFQSSLDSFERTYPFFHFLRAYPVAEADRCSGYAVLGVKPSGCSDLYVLDPSSRIDQVVYEISQFIGMLSLGMEIGRLVSVAVGEDLGGSVLL